MRWPLNAADCRWSGSRRITSSRVLTGRQACSISFREAVSWLSTTSCLRPTGWPSAGCPGCSLVVDNIGHLAHLHARDTSLAVVSRAPLANLESYKQRMGWTIPWFSSAGTDFNDDFGVTTAEGENFGLSVFLREGDSVFHTYFTTARGVEVLASNFTLLDMTPFGRQEEWEDSPAGWPQTPPYEWWRRHDEY